MQADVHPGRGCRHLTQFCSSCGASPTSHRGFFSPSIGARVSRHPIPVIVTSTACDQNARGGLRMLITANITASMLLHDFIALSVCRNAILVWLSLVRISYLRYRVTVTHVQVDV